MLYLALAVLSVCSCFVGFRRQGAEQSIVHIESGRPPNTGVAILPDILVVPIAYVLAAWGLNHVHPTAGYVAVAVYGCASIGVGHIHYRQLKRRLAKLLEHPMRTGASDAAEHRRGP